MRFFNRQSNKKINPALLAEQCIDQLKQLSEKERAIFVDKMITDLLGQDHQKIFWGDRLLTLGKSMSFLDDSKFSKAYQTIRGSHGYDQYDSPNTIAWRLHTLVWAAQSALKLDGDFVECGVFKGDFSWVVSEVTQFSEQSKTFYLYDTFEGFSKKYSSIADFPDSHAFFEMAHKVYSDPTLHEHVIHKFKNYSNVKIIKGVVPDSFEQAIPNKISYLHLDLNSPAAELAALKMLWDRIVKNGLIVFDDYGWHLFRQQRIVEDTFMAEKGYQILELPTGQGLVVKR